MMYRNISIITANNIRNNDGNSNDLNNKYYNVIKNVSISFFVSLSSEFIEHRRQLLKTMRIILCTKNNVFLCER